MNEFAELIRRTDSTNKTNVKVAHLKDYFNNAPEKDKIWAIALLIGKRPRRVISGNQTAEWAAELAGLPFWLFRESFHIVGDMSETISLVLPESGEKSKESLTWWMDFILQLGNLSEEQRKEKIFFAWNKLGRFETFVFNKLISGNFRIGISRQLVIRALALSTSKPVAEIAHVLMGNWNPVDTGFKELLEDSRSSDSKPYPFFLAYQLDNAPDSLGNPGEWQAEWKWDGIRGQIVKREGRLFVWTRGEELATESFPEFLSLENDLPDGTVLDGEILPYHNRSVQSFSSLQARIGRKKPGAAVLKKVPVAFFAYDLLETEGMDIRSTSLEERRKKLVELVESIARKDVLVLSPVIEFDDWNELAVRREGAREILSEGVMLKRKSAAYQAGRKRGDWWKWKVDPWTVDAVLIYVQRGSGKRAGIYTDYTFALWNSDGELVPFAKAYSGLTNEEIAEVNRFIRSNTIDKFGPVRSVKPELVFEIGFEGINESKRHKSGVAVRFPRILRWRKDKQAAEADNLEDLKKLLEQ